MTDKSSHGMEIIAFFNHVYNMYDRYWWLEEHRYSTRPEDHQGAHAKLLELLAPRPPGIALDLGAGEGADAIRLALLGYQVDAVEGSIVATQKIRAFAKQADVRVNVIHADVRKFKISNEYDVILCNGLLHYIENKSVILQRMQRATRIGGLNMVSVFTDFTPVPEVHRVIDVYCDKEDGIVRAFYRDWKHHFFLLERDKFETKHPGFPPHRHSFLKIIAEKPVV